MLVASALGSDISAIVAIVGVSVVGLLHMLDLFGWLPKKRTPMDAAAEVVLADRAVERIMKERDVALSENAALRLQRSNEPVLDLLHQVADACTQTLAKLSHVNGSLAAAQSVLEDTREGMTEATAAMLIGAEAMKYLADQVKTQNQATSHDGART